MTLFQLIMLGASAFFAYKIYEHINSLKDEDITTSQNNDSSEEKQEKRSAEAFSTFDASSLVEKADDALANDNYDKALAIYSEANIKAPKNDETLFKMGYVLTKQERYDEALEYFEEALALDAENPFTHLQMGLIFMKQEKNDKAVTYLKEALALEPELEEAQLALAKIEEA